MNNHESRNSNMTIKPDADGALRMPEPRPDKAPVKTNAYRYARQANTQLLPMFPYDGPGDIVSACTSIRAGGQSGKRGYFLHTNAVDEVMVSFGANGRVRTGDVVVGPKTHGVGGSGAAEFFALNVVTQRQLEEGEQLEAVAFACEACSQEIFKLSFSAFTTADHDGFFPPLPSNAGAAEAAARFNASEANRTCKACGHVSDPFPIAMWGWDKYLRATSVSEDARRALEEAIRK
ncbi:hypothetical protein PIGHUM_03571 [Pigmentiphaga humi]|uniref:Uncharacterized protein n=2 Tax=Pigmentiphaga humi TaxID=2478468 RepID=A0A3P4B7J4_9BURK|nr:hypothetical protein PIGHUM_03571 [Pigmentiphaga humi]